ncbi:MAG: hypothetical protein HY815_23560, partial [Candidatus Riflebacteria bacterium]|nr:hypothetical protein [Candidatus Riflebacteria bacterium]
MKPTRLTRRLAMSLIELLAAVSIITILTGAAFLDYRSQIPAAKEDRVRHDLATIADALSTYNRDNPTALYSTNDLEALRGRYLDELQVDPYGSDFIVDPFLQRVISSGPDQQLQTIVPGYAGSPQRSSFGDDYARYYGAAGQIT